MEALVKATCGTALLFRFRCSLWRLQSATLNVENHQAVDRVFVQGTKLSHHHRVPSLAIPEPRLPLVHQSGNSGSRVFKPPFLILLGNFVERGHQLLIHRFLLHAGVKLILSSAT